MFSTHIKVLNFFVESHLRSRCHHQSPLRADLATTGFSGLLSGNAPLPLPSYSHSHSDHSRHAHHSAPARTSPLHSLRHLLCPAPSFPGVAWSFLVPRSDCEGICMLRNFGIPCACAFAGPGPPRLTVSLHFLNTEGRGSKLHALPLGGGVTVTPADIAVLGRSFKSCAPARRYLPLRRVCSGSFRLFPLLVVPRSACLGI